LGIFVFLPMILTVIYLVFSPFLQNDGHLDCPLSANMGKTHHTASFAKIFAKTKDEWLICCWG
jgi:hypothetical protein